jgi:hypothetical protein
LIALCEGLPSTSARGSGQYSEDALCRLSDWLRERLGPETS